MGFLAVVRVLDFFCWGNPKRGVPIACARMRVLTALYLISLLCLYVWAIRFRFARA